MTWRIDCVAVDAARGIAILPAMPFVPFADYFPDLAPSETRSVLTYENGVETEARLFLELFCNERGCDCRRVMIQVYSDRAARREPKTTISWGWEPDAFYRKWAGFPLSKADLDELRGPGLVRLARHDDDAEELLGQFRMLIADQSYAARIVRHYQMVREQVEAGRGEDYVLERTAAPDADTTPMNRAERRRLAKLARTRR